MYDELIKNLRLCSQCDFGQNCNECTQERTDKFCCDELLHRAADAIKELQLYYELYKGLFERLEKVLNKRECIIVPWETCYQCKKRFMIPSYTDYVYKRQAKLFCKYSCMRAYDSDHEAEKEKRRQEYAKRKALHKKRLD